MKNINRKKFFDGYRKCWPLSQARVNALEFLLFALETDVEVKDPRWGAYILATTKHETADTFMPIKEYGGGHGRVYGRPDPDTGLIYCGRGFVQLTWKINYKEMGDLLGIDLVNHPNKALIPSVAYDIMSVGMREGKFTGAKLDHYIDDKHTDYVGARRIVNGNDRAQLIAGHAEKFQKILMEACDD